jgi:ABC-type cobalamin/Fe3+-siderophores transport system ATPase subunit
LWRRRLLTTLRLRAVPAWRPSSRRALGRALDEDVPAAAEGALARRRFLGSILEGAVLLPLLFLLAWKAALVGIAAAALLWPLLRYRNRRMKTLERAGVSGRDAARHAREDFEHSLESLPGAGFTEAITHLESTLDRAHKPEWMWRRAQARYPALLETGLFFVLCIILFTGAVTLPGLESVLLFAMLLLLAYRPLREAARQYPLSVSGARAARDLEVLIGIWNDAPVRAAPAPHPEVHTLATQNLTFGYEPEQPILKNVSLEFSARAITGLTGPNGAGKTTLLRLLSGAETPHAGEVLWPAAALEKKFADGKEAVRGVAVMPQRAWPGHDWAVWAVTFRATRPEDWKTLDALLGLESLRSKSQHPESLSGGERQRMTLARTIASDAAYLLLDEPTTALPADEREHVLRGALAFWKHAANESRGALIVSHEPFLANLCDTVVRLDTGRDTLRRETGQL